jgi:hypothetical protein
MYNADNKVRSSANLFPSSASSCVDPQHSEEAQSELEGAYGVLIFYTIVAGGLGRLSPVFVYVTAILASLIASIPWLKSKLVLPAE